MFSLILCDPATITMFSRCFTLPCHHHVFPDIVPAMFSLMFDPAAIKMLFLTATINMFSLMFDPAAINMFSLIFDPATINMCVP